MRTLIAALWLSLVAAPGWAQSNMERHVSDLTSTTSDLQGKTLDLVIAVQDLGGAARSVEGKRKDLQVRETATEIRMELAADVLFGFDSAEIQPKAADALKEVAGVIREKAGGGEVRVEGHTDSKGRDAYNQKLSERRANAVRDWLVRREGVKDVRITTRGFGETRPAAPNEKPDGTDDPEARQKNRRVEIVVKKG